uniref:Apple domain-containing protein n=1 Tax=Panagrolaimus davidi TaxID=227884 RepID=A0A914QRX6_9BILA
MAFFKLSIVFVLFVSIAASILMDQQMSARSLGGKKRDSCCDTYPDRNIVGQDLVTTAGQASDCCGICLGISGCAAYVWDNFLGGTCYLKNASGPVSFKAGSIAGDPCEGLKKAGKQ